MLKELVQKNRSYRRFFEDVLIPREDLEEMVDCARLCASGANRQPLTYLLSCTPPMNEQIFPTLAWAGYLTDWPGPIAGERPSAYVMILTDKNYPMAGGVDHGIAAQTILLAAAEKGYGGCMIGSIKKPELQEILQIPDHYEIALVIALGKPKETVVIDELLPGGDVKYWRDENQVHHVPKRRLSDIIINR